MIVAPTSLSESENANSNSQNVMINETNSELKAMPIGNLVSDMIRTNNHMIWLLSLRDWNFVGVKFYNHKDYFEHT